MTIQSCRLCGSRFLQVFLERKDVPVHQNVVCATEEEAHRFARGNLSLALCRDCGFVFNAAFKPECLKYGAGYNNSQSYSPYFRHYVSDMAVRLVAKYGLVGKLIIEVGCGQGEFLKLLCSGGKNRGVGFDPSYVGPDTEGDGAVRFVRTYYNEDQSGYPPDFVCCRHVIEHLQFPLVMLRAVRRTIGERTGAVVYFETPDLNWILETGAFWDFFYEHCSYFSERSLVWAFRQAGFKVIDAYSTFNGQYLCIEARSLAGATPAKVCAPEGLDDLRAGVDAFARTSRERLEACKQRITSFLEAGGCAVWGAAAKGVTLANLVDPDRGYISCLIDVNPEKQERFIPGSGHKIVSPEYLRHTARLPGGIINMNPNYLEENRSILKTMSLDIPIISL